MMFFFPVKGRPCVSKAFPKSKPRITARDMFVNSVINDAIDQSYVDKLAFNKSCPVVEDKLGRVACIPFAIDFAAILLSQFTLVCLFLRNKFYYLSSLSNCQITMQS